MTRPPARMSRSTGFVAHERRRGRRTPSVYSGAEKDGLGQSDERQPAGAFRTDITGLKQWIARGQAEEKGHERSEIGPPASCPESRFDPCASGRIV